MRRSFSLLPYLLGIITIIASCADARAQKLVLPTCNRELLIGNDSLFYQKTATGRAQPWTAGRYGFVRNPRSVGSEQVFTRFHEGMDIRPLYRNKMGIPLDTVMAVAEGRVVRVSPKAGGSNYGRYIVIEHIIDGSPYYSLYAHLADTLTTEGRIVRQGEAIGILGYTGVGINRERAHLHFELALLLNEHFNVWYEPLWPNDSNEHGPYNGMNLVGLDAASLYIALHRNPALTIPEFLRREPAYYKVIVPRRGRLDLLRRYPWLQTEPGAPADSSWLISFDRSGVPLRVETSTSTVEEPAIVEIECSPVNYSLRTKGRVSGSENRFDLTPAGTRYIELIACQPPEEGSPSEAGRPLPSISTGPAIRKKERKKIFYPVEDPTTEEELAGSPDDE